MPCAPLRLARMLTTYRMMDGCRILGGFLSAYALSGDELYKLKSVELADRLLYAFETKTGIPASVVNLKEGGNKTVLHNPFNGQTYNFGDATTVRSIYAYACVLLSAYSCMWIC